MYLTIGDILAIMIVLGVSMFLIIITTIANYQLQKENKFLRNRLRAWRKSCTNHVEVPF
jgi:hypothetical protein